MGPLKRKLRQSYSMTSRELQINSKQPWYVNLGLAIAVFVLGYAIAFWQFSQRNVEIDALKMDKQSLEVQIIKLERQLQIEGVAQEKIQSNLNEVQEELLHVKEELVFYQRLNKKKRK